jgi:two-component system sensor histidine kinase CiaH
MKNIAAKFHKKSLQLAGLYLAIIFAISIFFSVTIYQLSVQELDRGLRGPRGYAERALPNSVREDIAEEREELYTAARDRVLSRLIMTNIFIVIAGGALSYYLALRTLRPIEQAQEAQNRFTADASHELRTPITAMMTENEVTLMDPKLSLADAKKQISSNIEELQKLTDLSDGLMRLAGLENSMLQTVPVNLSTVLSGAQKRIQQKADASTITITSKITNDDIVVTGDEHSLVEVLVILLDNAIKYSPERSGVIVTIAQQDKLAVISIKDTGIGIKASDIPHVFDRFYRADSSRTKQHIQGYGLGLAIAKDIITKHKGTIDVTSTPNKGTTFRITLPIAS